MAVTWNVQIVVVTNLAERRARVTAIRTDDVAQTTWTYSQDAQIASGATEQQVADGIVADAWAAWQAEQSKAGQVAAFLGSIESLAETGLDAQEGS